MAKTDGEKGDAKTPELTLEAKAAIQAYMLKFVIPSGTVVALISGLCGYVLSGISKIDASKEAATIAFQASVSSAKSQSSAEQASAQALKASGEINTALTQAKSASEQSKGILDQLNSSRDQLNKILLGDYDALAKPLFASKSFRDALSNYPESEIGSVKSSIRKIESTLYGASDAPIPTPSGQCPPGSYVTGVGSISAPGGRAGFVESISVICRVLRFERPK
ncbi:hypothetical protein [Methylobacterium brachiatum]|uniref:hypothetical protein n=1 Tax=Methylobacterium brachiatum TaxID=269660 RepID=UPI0024494EAE|nr:hypothetical protein [Methylobacterium brachiatum]MDH2313991.1 hypothetical protein [Methylobacterium brachiatum]